MNDYTHEKHLARAAVMNYLEGTTDPSQERLTEAFYSSTNLHSTTDDGLLEIVPRDRFIRFAGNGKLPQHTNEILSLELVGDMAWSSVKFDLPDREFFDILTLLRLSEGWKIVSKTYTVIMK
jgi:hypothetical protein